MSVVAVTSSRTSPGATSLAVGLAIAWSHLAEKSLLIEADPAGGVLALRFGLAPAPSLTTFASDVRNHFASELLWANTQDLRGVHCMPAPVDPRLARTWIERVTPTLVSEVPKLGAPTVIDLGWVDERGASAPLASAADTTLVVTTPDTAEVQGLLFQIRRLQAEGANVALVTIGDSPNDPQEIATLAGIPLAAVLPHDPQVAAALAGGKFNPTKFRRSLLWRTISGLAETLFDDQQMVSRATQVQYPAPTGAPTYPAVVAAPAEPLITPTPSVAPVVVATYTPVLEAPISPIPAPSVPAEIPARENTQYGFGAIDPGLFDETKRLAHRNVAALVLPGGGRQELDVDSAVLVGRHNDCAVTVDDSQVSRRHGRLTHTNAGWHYADLGSRNGSSLNGERCTDALLTSGDVLTVGRTQLTFQTTSIREMECA